MPSWEGLGAELGITSAHAIVVVLSAVGIYMAFLVFVRIFGQRVLTAMSTFDVVITVMLGAVAGRVILGHPPTLMSGVLGLGTLFLLEVVFGHLGTRARWQRVFNSPARLLMIGDRVDEHALRRAHITHSELNGALRRAGVRSLRRGGVRAARTRGRDQCAAPGGSHRPPDPRGRGRGGPDPGGVPDRGHRGRAT